MLYLDFMRHTESGGRKKKGERRNRASEKDKRGMRNERIK
jgi:hypothetical protein